MFNRVFLPRQELQDYTYPSGRRVYKTPIGEMESVTTPRSTNGRIESGKLKSTKS
jgi:hypothetical protein